MEKGIEALDNFLEIQRSPLDKYGLGFKRMSLICMQEKLTRKSPRNLSQTILIARVRTNKIISRTNSRSRSKE